MNLITLWLVTQNQISMWNKWALKSTALVANGCNEIPAELVQILKDDKTGEAFIMS